MSVTQEMTTQLLGLIPNALAAVTGEVRPRGNGAWHLLPTSASSGPVQVRLHGEFLRFDSAVEGLTEDQWWGMVTANAELEGLVKFTLDGADRIRLQAELPVSTEIDFVPRIQQVMAGFNAGTRFVQTGSMPPSAPAEPATAPSNACDLEALCSEAGWPSTGRGAGRRGVVLETHRGAYVASLSQSAPQVSVGTDLCVWDSLEPLSRTAIARGLLTVSGLVRMARTTLSEDEDSIVARLEVCFDPLPTGTELNHALRALSVGCDLCAAQVELLQDGVAAEQFLSVRGGPRHSRRKQHAQQKRKA